MNTLIWILTALFFVVTVVSSFDFGPTINWIMPPLSVISLFSAVCLHGFQRYGAKNMLVFFIITWLISHFFEALSIYMGFPFGHYHYDKLAGPRIFDVPLIIMFAYFSMAYLSWMLSNVLQQLYAKRLKGINIFLIPFVATFIMVMWDLCMDPLSSTIGSLWVWKNGGSYFGVPLQNYFGWFLVVYLIFQTFAVYISTFDKLNEDEVHVVSHKAFWHQAATLYGIQGLFQIVSPFTVSEHPEIYGPMALVALFTMMFVTLLAFITISHSESRTVQ